MNAKSSAKPFPMTRKFKTIFFQLAAQPGTVLEQIAKPIAVTMDKKLGTNLKHCEGCTATKRALNLDATRGEKAI